MNTKRIAVLVVLAALVPSIAIAQSPRVRLRTGVGTFVSPATVPTDSGQIFLSDRETSLNSNGFGPVELDESNGESGTSDGTTIALSGVTYSKGIGTHSPSTLRYALNKQCSRFRAVIGVDDEVGSLGSVVFQVWANGTLTAGTQSSYLPPFTGDGGILLYQSSTMTGASAPVNLDIDVSGRYELTLIATAAGDGNTADHADWAFARVTGCTTPSGTRVEAGGDIQAALTAGSTGATFVLGHGTHYITSALAPKTGQTITGEFGSILTGGITLSSWTTATGGTCATTCYYATGQTQDGTDVGITGNCTAQAEFGNHANCFKSEDVFFDGVLQGHESSLGACGAGEWYFDYAADRIYVCSDPTGHTVQTSITQSAFTASGNIDDVVITNLTIQMFAADGQSAAVGLGNSGSGAQNWTLQDSEVRWNHGAGVSHDEQGTATRNYVHHNGIFGFIGAGTGGVVSYNECSFNNTLGWDLGQGSGCSKWVYSAITVTHNWSHHNIGPGFWTDINNVGVTYSDNVIEYNVRAGIFHEVSYSAVIHDNVIRYNGWWERALGGSFTLRGSCLQIVSSRDVEAYANTCSDNANGIMAFQDSRGTGNDGVYETANLDIHDNAVCQLSGRSSGLDDTETSGSSSPYHTGTKGNAVSFAGNDYIGPGADGSFAWKGDVDLTFAEFQAFSQDTTGSGGSRTTSSSCP